MKHYFLAALALFLSLPAHAGRVCTSSNAACIQTECRLFFDVDATDTVTDFPWVPPADVTILAFDCRCDSAAAPTTIAQVQLDNSAGSSIASAVTCVGKNTAMGFTALGSPPTLAAGTPFRIHVTNTPNPSYYEYTVCVKYK